VQTFLPYPSFTRSAQCLDDKRLGKQRVEVLQILNAMSQRSGGWYNHPATRMWRSHPMSLVKYGMIVCRVWTARGFNDTCYAKIRRMSHEPIQSINLAIPPPWFGDRDFHRAHKSNLVRKNPDHYRQFFPNVPDDLEYIWPVE
jgi:hypothetical protein